MFSSNHIDAFCATNLLMEKASLLEREECFLRTVSKYINALLFKCKTLTLIHLHYIFRISILILLQ